PSEAQWEYGSRAGSTTLFHWGDRHPFPEERYTENHSTNAFGLCDMGAVPEICADDWHATYRDAPVDDHPWSDEPRAAPALAALAPSTSVREGKDDIEKRIMEPARRELAENVDLSKEIAAAHAEIRKLSRGPKGEAKRRPVVGDVVRGGCAVHAP